MPKFFSTAEMLSIEAAMQEMEGVGITVESFRNAWKETGGDLRRVDTEERSFKGLARLWKVVQRIISLCFIEKLVSGRLQLCDEEGNKYCLTLTEKAPEHRNFFSIPDPDPEDFRLPPPGQINVYPTEREWVHTTLIASSKPASVALWPVGEGEDNGNQD